MIHHYINLVCWRAMLDIYDPKRDIVWVDTVSMGKLVARFRNDFQYRPGTSVLNSISSGSIAARKWFFLTASPLEKVKPEAQFVLPILESTVIPNELAVVLGDLQPRTRIGIGISSPKQNQLAVALHALRPDLEYHCLGAALHGLNTMEGLGEMKSRWCGSGFEWLKFLIVSPHRTLQKISFTLREGWAVQTHGPSIEAFERFAFICAPACLGRPGVVDKREV